ncbi:MAG: hypothetical protein J7M26_04010, partial [Armatimonadetes bacterium]|nr:hypothetical protein [Armatimonadota bacterium]
MTKPRYRLLRHPSVQRIERGLRAWARGSGGALKVEVAGRSVQGRPVLAAFVTDPQAPAEHKQHVLLTATHAGCELNSCTGLLRFLRWLIGPSKAAQRLRRHYV